MLRIPFPHSRLSHHQQLFGLKADYQLPTDLLYYSTYLVLGAGGDGGRQVCRQRSLASKRARLQCSACAQSLGSLVQFFVRVTSLLMPGERKGPLCQRALKRGVDERETKKQWFSRCDFYVPCSWYYCSSVGGSDITQAPIGFKDEVLA